MAPAGPVKISCFSAPPPYPTAGSATDKVDLYVRYVNNVNVALFAKTSNIL